MKPPDDNIVPRLRGLDSRGEPRSAPPVDDGLRYGDDLPAPRFNAYWHAACRKAVFTVERIKCVTPFLLACPFCPPGPQSFAESAFYRLVGMPPEVARQASNRRHWREWYQPKGDSLRAMSSGMRSHVAHGGAVPRNYTGPMDSILEEFKRATR